MCSEDAASSEEARLCNAALLDGRRPRTDDLQSFRQPHGQLYALISLLHYSVHVVEAPTFPITCRFPVFVALCDHNPPTLQRDLVLVA